MFRSVLIANRGEIALRILRACRMMNLQTVVIYSEADREAPYLALADRTICIGPGAAKDSYLNQAAILFAAETTGAQAIHPGYGFLSENALFAERVCEAGLTFIGPTASSMRMMGDKIEAKKAMRAAGVPCVPGSEGSLPDQSAEVHRMASAIGYPLILKAAGGGGGRGMRVVTDPAMLDSALALTREEGSRAFGNDAIYIEKFLQHPRHVEIQVIADKHGNALWLGSRDCSLQRRHQKVLEEAPAPGIEASALAKLGASCAKACREIGYVGAGTFEFLYEDGNFFFIEMNTRLQVEHPITEAVTGLDIVALQILVAQGHPLPLRQDDVICTGHAFECRINAEDARTFIPSPGKITEWRMPAGPGVRLDSHVCGGYRVPSYYDSLIGKLIVHGATREQALDRLRAALGEAAVGGISTNLDLHRAIVADPRFTTGGVDINYLEAFLFGSEHAS